MIPGDLGDVPMLAFLNKPQKRALTLRDRLRYLEPAHLDTFLDGVTADEPPTYRNINGTVKPPLTQITIKEDATRFDLGNVQFPEEGGKTYHVHLTVEDGRFEMRTDDPLAKEDAELESVAIHRFVAENMFPLFKAKYKAIHARMEKMNEARRVAYNMHDHPPAKFEEGETIARLHPNPDPTHGKSTSPACNPRKRKPILRHASNKRPRLSLSTIPDAVKTASLDALPAAAKIGIFNTVMGAAFPALEALLTASWNVVSVYANVGSDFPELHRAVVEMKGALEEFERGVGGSGAGTGGRGRRREGVPGVKSEGGGCGGKQRVGWEEDGSQGDMVAASTALPPRGDARPDVDQGNVGMEDGKDDGGKVTTPQPHPQPPPRVPLSPQPQPPPSASPPPQHPTTTAIEPTQETSQTHTTRSPSIHSPSHHRSPPAVPDRDPPGSALMRKRLLYASSLPASRGGAATAVGAGAGAPGRAPVAGMVARRGEGC